MFRDSRMLGCMLVSVCLLALALLSQLLFPGGILAVSAYKAHLLALGGWGGYWLDRGLFPYGRPHEYLLEEEDAAVEGMAEADGFISGELVAHRSFGIAMLRRAVIVAACLICVGLGA